MTQTDLALACEVTQATVSDIETAKGNPSFECLCRIAKALDVPPFALIGADLALRELRGALPRGEAFGSPIGNLVQGFSEMTFARWLAKTLLSTANDGSLRRADGEPS